MLTKFLMFLSNYLRPQACLACCQEPTLTTETWMVHMLLPASQRCQAQVRRRHEQCDTLTAVKPGRSKASKVGHKLCKRGWLLLLLFRTGSSVCRCCSVKKAAAAAGWTEAFGCLKKPAGGGSAALGSRLVPCRTSAGRQLHSRTASNSACT